MTTHEEAAYTIYIDCHGSPVDLPARVQEERQAGGESRNDISLRYPSVRES